MLGTSSADRNVEQIAGPFAPWPSDLPMYRFVLRVKAKSHNLKTPDGVTFWQSSDLPKEHQLLPQELRRVRLLAKPTQAHAGSTRETKQGAVCPGLLSSYMNRLYHKKTILI